MFQKFNSLTNTLSLSDRISAYIPQSLGTKETTNNFFLAPQPKGNHPDVSHSSTPLTSSKQSNVGSLSSSTSATSSVPAAKAHSVATSSAGHGHGSHPAPWEGVNLWRTPFKGDTDTITHTKRNPGTLDKYIENRVRRVQQLQILALRNKSTPTWVMMPRDKLLFLAQGAIVSYVLYELGKQVYNHLKAKDRLKLIKLVYKDNVD